MAKAKSKRFNIYSIVGTSVIGGFLTWYMLVLPAKYFAVRCYIFMDPATTTGTVITSSLSQKGSSYVTYWIEINGRSYRGASLVSTFLRNSIIKPGETFEIMYRRDQPDINQATEDIYHWAVWTYVALAGLVTIVYYRSRRHQSRTSR